MAHVYAVRYVHRISPKDTDRGADIVLVATDLEDRKKLAASLRAQGILGEGDSIASFRKEPGGKIVVFPRGQTQIWHAIVLTEKQTESDTTDRLRQRAETIERRRRSRKAHKEFEKQSAIDAKLGDRIVRFSDGRQKRFSEPREGYTFAEEVLKKMPAGSRAEFFFYETPTARATGFTPPYTSEPYAAMDVDERGHVHHASLKRSGNMKLGLRGR